MNRSSVMKALYLASAIGTSMLLGCSGTDGSEEGPPQAGKSGAAGAKSVFSGLAGAPGASNATAGAGGAASAGAGSGGTSGAGAAPSAAGFPNAGRDSIGFGGFAGNAGYGTVIRTDIDDGFGGTGNVQITFGGTNIQISFGGGDSWSLGGVGGTQFRISR